MVLSVMDTVIYYLYRRPPLIEYVATSVGSAREVKETVDTH